MTQKHSDIGKEQRKEELKKMINNNSRRNEQDSYFERFMSAIKLV